MIWLNPWAWLGALTLAVPILVHLLARRQAPRRVFPTLRFLQKMPVVQARRHKLTDVMLLLVRCGVILAAVAALAHPLLLTESRREQLASQLTRVIVLDTSASMHRTTASGELLLNAGRTLVDDFTESATMHLLIESASPKAELRGAASWLSNQRGRREVVVISDFQFGTIDSSLVSELSTDAGLKLVRVADGDSAAVDPLRSSNGDSLVTTTMTVLGGATVGDWLAVHNESNAANMLALASDRDSRLSVATTRAAANSVSSMAAGTFRPVTVVFPDYAEISALVVRATPAMQPWMGDILLALANDAGTFAAAASEANMLTTTSESRAAVANLGLPVAVRTRNGEPLAYAAAIDSGGDTRLTLFLTVPPGSFTAASILAALYRAASPAGISAEHDPRFLSDMDLAALNRPIPDIVNAEGMTTDGASDARWFWLLALTLLGCEWLLRRRTTNGATGKAVT